MTEWRLGHRPALDGVRAIAVLIVLASHSLVPGFLQGGRGGVAVFFTLSGFLITTLLLEERKDSGRIGMGAFYVRRLRRLLPAQAFCAAVVTLLAALLGWGVFLQPTQAAAALFYLKNLQVSNGDALAHFWSLAVEEQFYLVWAPILAWLLARGLTRNRLMGVLCVGAVVSVAARIAFGGFTVGWFAAATSLPLMSDGLLFGCALAVWMSDRPEGRTRNGAAVVAVLVILGLSGGLSRTAMGTWGPVAVGGATVVLLWAVVQGTGPGWLRSRGMQWLGTRSYSIYLWHYPFTFTVRLFGADSFWEVLPWWPVVFVFAELSYRCIEQPFRVRHSGSSPEPVGAAQRAR